MLKKYTVLVFLATAISVFALSAPAMASFFPATLILNTTGQVDSRFTGAPDDVHWGLGGQVVVYDFGLNHILNGTGQDFNIYETDNGSVEFSKIDVFVSQDNVTWYQVDDSMAAGVRITGDEVHGNDNFFKSYDLDIVGLDWARYLKIDGVGDGGSGSVTGFDLDAVGAINHATTGAAVPLPGAVWLLGSGLMGLIGVRRKVTG